MPRRSNTQKVTTLPRSNVHFAETMAFAIQMKFLIKTCGATANDDILNYIKMDVPS